MLAFSGSGGLKSSPSPAPPGMAIDLNEEPQASAVKKKCDPGQELASPSPLTSTKVQIASNTLKPTRDGLPIPRMVFVDAAFESGQCCSCRLGKTLG